MKLSLYIGLAGLGLMLAGGIAWAQPGSDQARPDAVEHPPVYRVEAIVFRHTNGRHDRARAAGPVDYTDHLDPLLVAAANELAEQRLAELARVVPPVAVSGPVGETTPFLRTEDETIRPIPPAYAALGDLSGPAQRAMARLIGAPAYEPVITRAWMQPAPRQGDTARVRLHDETVVDVLEPADSEKPAPIDARQRFETMNSGAVAATTAPASPALEIYRLDGTIRLRRRQFLHLDLDLTWQTPIRALGERSERPVAIGDVAGDWQLHRLQQSRIVEPGRLEYFDSSLFGVLVLIERFEQVVPEIEVPEPEPEAPALETGETAGQVTD